MRKRSPMSLKVRITSQTSAALSGSARLQRATPVRLGPSAFCRNELFALGSTPEAGGQDQDQEQEQEQEARQGEATLCIPVAITSGLAAGPFDPESTRGSG